jgi:hypothetical protein
MSYLADAVVCGAHGEPVLVVEVKTRTGTSRQWAARMRQSFLEHADAPKTRFLLLALPDRFYLWEDSHLAPPDADPTYEIDPAPLLDPYYQGSGLRPESIGPEAFELIVSSCLSEWLWADELSQLPPESQEWLRASGLFESVKGGHLASEVRV